VALSFAVLQELALPVTVEEVARRLAVEPLHLQRELERLERRGYARRIACGAGACGWCALKATCAADAPERWLRG
jgi:predicted transcriptional regulator of viral defense system